MTDTKKSDGELLTDKQLDSVTGGAIFRTSPAIRQMLSLKKSANNTELRASPTGN